MSDSSAGTTASTFARAGSPSPPYPPLGLLYLSAYLKARGYAVSVFDTTFSRPDAFAAHVARHRPPVVGIYGNLVTRPNVLAQIRACKAHGATVVLGNDYEFQMIENKTGLTPEAIHAKNPHIIYTAVTGYGLEGPEAARPGFEDAIEIYAGAATQFTLFGHAPGVYYYRVRAVQAAQSSDWSGGQVVHVAPLDRWVLNAASDELSPDLLTLHDGDIDNIYG
mgnify:CR=1 FL=1